MSNSTQSNQQIRSTLEKARNQGEKKNLPMDGVSILQRWLDLNGITIKRLAKHSGYSKDYIKRVLDRAIPINRNFAIAASGVTGILAKFLMETDPHPHAKPTPAQPEFDEDWGEMPYIPQGESATAGILEEE